MIQNATAGAFRRWFPEPRRGKPRRGTPLLPLWQRRHAAAEGCGRGERDGGRGGSDGGVGVAGIQTLDNLRHNWNRLLGGAPMAEKSRAIALFRERIDTAHGTEG